MAKYGNKPNFQKCEPSQKKIAFKEAYRTIRTLLAPTKTNFLDKKLDAIDDANFNAIHMMIDKMPYKYATSFHDAVLSALWSQHSDISFESHSLQLRLYDRKKGRIARKGALPA